LSISRKHFGVTALLARFGDQVLGRGSRLFRSDQVDCLGLEEGTGRLISEVTDDGTHTVTIEIIDGLPSSGCDCGRQDCAHQAAALLDVGRSPEALEAAPELAKQVPWQVVLRRGIASDGAAPAPVLGRVWLVYRFSLLDSGDVEVACHKVQALSLIHI